MRHVKQFLVMLLLAVSGAGFSQVDLEDSVLWKVEHESLEEPSYIMGTIHLACKSDDLIPEKVITALGEVDDLILEIDFDDPAEMKAMQSTVLEATPISEELSEEEFSALDKKIQEFMGVPLSALDKMGLFGLYSFVSTKFVNCGQPVAYEFELLNWATKNEMEVIGLETVKEQVAALSNAMDKDDLLEFFDDLDMQKANFNKALKLYQEENIDEVLMALSGGEELTEEELEHMLVNRNKNWVEKIPAMITEDSALIAVGTGHLLEEFGIINLLREKGYTVTPVF